MGISKAYRYKTVALALGAGLLSFYSTFLHAEDHTFYAFAVFQDQSESPALVSHENPTNNGLQAEDSREPAKKEQPVEKEKTIIPANSTPSPSGVRTSNYPVLTSPWKGFGGLISRQ